MDPLIAAVALSVVSAVAYALAAVVQARLAAQDRPVLTGYTRPGFLLAVLLNALGAGLHVLALRYGSLAAVQPLGALTLVFALPLGAAFAGRRVTGREWRGVAATVVGLAGLLLTVDTGVPTEALHNHEILIVVGVTGTALCAFAVPPVGSVRSRGLRLAAGGGIAFGVASVLTQTLVLRMLVTRSDGGRWSEVLVWIAPAIAVLVVVGLLLAQAAYRAGLGAPLAMLTIVNPVIAASIGLVLLDQGAAISVGEAVVGLVAAVLAARGVVLLATPQAAARRPWRCPPVPRPCGDGHGGRQLVGADRWRG